MMFLVISKPPPTVFNQQTLDWVHCEEETGAHAGIFRQTSKLVHFFYTFFNVIFCKKKKLHAFQKILYNLLIFSQRDISAYVYIY